MGSLGLPELIIVGIIALLIFGPKKLPELGSGLGKAIRDFKGAMSEPEEPAKPELKAKEVAMEFSYDEAFMVEPAEAYERLIHDVMENDQTLFVREDAVERAWAIVQPLIDQPPPVTFYPAGTWGPTEADQLVAPHQWHLR